MQNGLLDRIATIEKQLEDLVKGTQAIARVVGVSEVQAELASAAQANMKAQVDSALKQGQLTPADAVTDTGFIVGHEKGKDGKLAFPGRFQVPVQAMTEDTRKLFVGKKPGETIDVPNGVITIDEAYDLVEAAAQAAPAPAPKRTKAKAN